MKGSSNKKLLSRKSIKSNMTKGIRQTNEFSPIVNKYITKPFRFRKGMENDNSFNSPSDISSFDALKFRSQNDTYSKQNIDVISISKFNSNPNNNKNKDICEESSNNNHNDLKLRMNYKVNRKVEFDKKNSKGIHNSKKTNASNNKGFYSREDPRTNFSHFSSKVRKSVADKTNSNNKEDYGSKEKNENGNKIFLRRPKSFNYMGSKENTNHHQRNKSSNLEGQIESTTKYGNQKFIDSEEENHKQVMKDINSHNINNNRDTNDQRNNYEKSLSVSKMVKRAFIDTNSDKNHFHFNQSLRSYHKELFHRKSSIAQIIRGKIIGEPNQQKEEPYIEEIKTGILKFLEFQKILIS